MIDALIRFAVDRRWLVLAATLLVAAAGVYSTLKLPIDAVLAYYQCSGTDKFRSARLFAIRNRTTYFLSGGNRDGRFTKAGLHPLDLTLWVVASYRGV